MTSEVKAVYAELREAIPDEHVSDEVVVAALNVLLAKRLQTLQEAEDDVTRLAHALGLFIAAEEEDDTAEAGRLHAAGVACGRRSLVTFRLRRPLQELETA